MPDGHSLTSRQADRLWTDAANVQSGIEVIIERVVRLPTRKELWRAVLTGDGGRVGAHDRLGEKVAALLKEQQHHRRIGNDSVKPYSLLAIGSRGRA